MSLTAPALLQPNAVLRGLTPTLHREGERKEREGERNSEREKRRARLEEERIREGESETER